MARLYADENFHLNIVDALRKLGHDVLTARDAGQANQGIPDERVLQFAISNSRTVLTFDRWHFIRLHGTHAGHGGIIVCSEDNDWHRLAHNIHAEIQSSEPLSGKLLRVNKPTV